MQLRRTYKTGGTTMQTVTVSPGDTRHGTGTGRSPWRYAIVAAGAAAAVNAAIFAIAVGAGIFPSLGFSPDAGASMSIEPVLLVSVLGTLAGVGVFTLLRGRVARPVPTFLRLAAVVLVASFAAPFLIPGTVLAQAVVLNVLHVPVAAAVVWAVLRA